MNLVQLNTYINIYCQNIKYLSWIEIQILQNNYINSIILIYQLNNTFLLSDVQSNVYDTIDHALIYNK